MKEVTPREVVILLELIAFLTPRQRNFFLKTLNKKQMRVMEVATFSLAQVQQRLMTPMIFFLKLPLRLISFLLRTCDLNVNCTSSTEMAIR